MIFNSKYLTIITLFMTVLPLSACVSVLPEAKDAPIVYRLNVPRSADITPVSNTTVINIEFPQAPRALSGTDIVLSPDGRRLTAAAGATWAEPVPNQIRSALIDALAKDGKITGVIPKGGRRVPYRLNMDVRRFEAVFDRGEEAAPKAVVHINLALTDTNTRNLIGTYTVSTSERAGAKTVSAIVDAQDGATDEAMRDIAAWLGELVGTGRS